MKTQSYNKFWQRIHQSAKNNSFPLRVMFELTYRCNFYCSHCYVPLGYRKYKELKRKEVFYILDQLKEIGCFYLGFTGGEPFVRKDIMDILWYAKRCGFEIIIYTNGSLINERVANELARLRPNKIDITIPAMSKVAFEHITKASGSYEKVFRTIKLLNKRKVNLGFKTCVLKENADEIGDIQKFAEELAAFHRLDNRLLPCLDGSKEPFRYRGKLREAPHASRPTPHAKRYTPHAVDSLTEACNVKRAACNVKHEANNSESLFKCGVGQSQAAITPLGELKMCVMIDYPKYRIRCTPHASRYTPHAQSSMREACNVKREAYSLKEAWKKLKELVASIKPDENYQCDTCKLSSLCKWCPAKAWLENRNFTNCNPESRYWAENRYKLLNC